MLLLPSPPSSRGGLLAAVECFGCILLLALLPLIDGQTTSTLQQILESTPNVSMFWTHLLDSRITALETSKCVASGECLTVLAPNNAAWQQKAASLSWPTLSIEEKQKIIYGQYLESPKSGSVPTRLSSKNWRTAGQALALIDVGFGQGALYNEIVGPRYAFSIAANPGVYFINDAKVIERDIEASNGMIHVMDKVVHYPFEFMNFFTYLSQARDLTKTMTLWNKLRITGMPLYTQLTNQIYMGKNLFATYFVVPDSVWNKLPAKAYEDLLNNETLMINVLASSYAPNQLFYPKWVEDGNRELKFFVGFPQHPLPSSVSPDTLTPGKMGGSAGQGQVTITIGSSYAETTGPAVALRNAVLIPVSSPMGYLHETTVDALARLSPNFLRVCTQDTACNTILQSTTEKTIFAPIDWSHFNKLPPTNQSEYLKLMIIPERILRSQMTADKFVTVGTIQDAIRFRSINNVINVEARMQNQGYVPVGLVESESSGSDGVVYLVRGVPGLPVQTVRNFLGGDSRFSNFVLSGILDRQIKGGPYTYFAADNNAFDLMKADPDVGQKILSDPKRLTYVLRRMIFPLPILLNEMSTVVRYDVATANNAFTLEYDRFELQVEGGVHVALVNGTVKVSMSNGGYQCTDGWIYPADKVFYLAEDLTRPLCTMPACHSSTMIP